MKTKELITEAKKLRTLVTSPKKLKPEQASRAFANYLREEKNISSQNTEAYKQYAHALSQNKGTKALLDYLTSGKNNA